MLICPYCGKEFDEYETGLEFDTEYLHANEGVSYSCLKKPCCYDCAAERIRQQGLWEEECDNCGRIYDPFMASNDFREAVLSSSLPYTSDTYYDIQYRNGTLCASCGMVAYQSEVEHNSEP